MLCPWRFKMPAYYVLCLAYLARRVAAAYMLIGAYVVLFLVEYLWGTGCTRLLNIMDGRQHLVFHLDELLCLFEGLPVLGSNQGDSVAQIMHKAAHGYHGILIVLEMADLVFPRYILGCQHSRHSGQCPCGGGIYGQHAGAGVFASQGGAVQHPLHIVVVGVLAGAEHLFLGVKALHPGAYFPVVVGRLRYHAGALYLGRQLDSVDYLNVARAAAVVVAYGVAHLRLCGVRVLIQQRFCAHHHAGYAKAALHRPRLCVGEGVHLLFPVAQALYRNYIAALQLVCIRHAGLAGNAVYYYGAGAAGALAAPVLDRGKAQIVPEKAEELFVFLRRNGMPVHNKCGHKRFLSFSSLISYLSLKSNTPGAHIC